MTREEAILKWIMPAIKNTWNEKKCNEILKALEQEPCEDAISRQAVLEIAKSSKSNWIDNSVLFKRVNELPPVTPKPKTDVLDKIKAEIEEVLNDTPTDNDCAICKRIGLQMALEIIDKHIAERSNNK